MPVRFVLAGYPLGRGGELDAVIGVRGLDPEGGGELGLAGAGLAQHHHVAGLFRERHRCQGRDLLTDSRLEIEVEVLQCPDGGEPRGTNGQPVAGGVADQDFGF